MQEMPHRLRTTRGRKRREWMDIAGAKALKTRLGRDVTDGALPPSANVPEDAPPVFHWCGVSNAQSEASSAGTEDESAGRERIVVSSPGLSLR
jgi:hypothetical protein